MANNTKLTEKDLISGFYYEIKCGWGITEAKYLYSIDNNGKRQHNWITNKGFRFHSFDLDDTKEL